MVLYFRGRLPLSGFGAVGGDDTFNTVVMTSTNVVSMDSANVVNMTTP